MVGCRRRLIVLVLAVAVLAGIQLTLLAGNSRNDDMSSAHRSVARGVGVGGGGIAVNQHHRAWPAPVDLLPRHHSNGSSNNNTIAEPAAQAPLAFTDAQTTAPTVTAAHLRQQAKAAKLVAAADRINTLRSHSAKVTHNKWPYTGHTPLGPAAAAVHVALAKPPNDVVLQKACEDATLRPPCAAGCKAGTLTHVRGPACEGRERVGCTFDRPVNTSDLCH